MGSDSPPDDVGLPWDSLVVVGGRRAAVSVVDGARAGGLVGQGSQAVEKLIAGIEDRAAAACRTVDFDLLLALLPLRRPVPRLGGVALDARSQQNAVADDFGIEFAPSRRPAASRSSAGSDSRPSTVSRVITMTSRYLDTNAAKLAMTARVTAPAVRW